MEEEGEGNGESTYQFLNLVPLPPISIINNDNFSSTTRYKRIKHPLRRQEGGKRLNGYTRGKNWLFA